MTRRRRNLIRESVAFKILTDAGLNPLSAESAIYGIKTNKNPTQKVKGLPASSEKTRPVSMTRTSKSIISSLF